MKKVSGVNYTIIASMKREFDVKKLKVGIIMCMMMLFVCQSISNVPILNCNFEVFCRLIGTAIIMLFANKNARKVKLVF